MLKVLLAGGGTAGHVNPALAIAEIIKERIPDADFMFAGTPDGLEAKLIPNAGYKFSAIKVKGFQRKITLKNIKRNALAIKYLTTAGHRAKQIIQEFNPDLVIGTGGYVSGPIVRAASKMGIKTAIHEQNAYPGVTTKLLTKHVDKVMLTVKEAAKYFDDDVEYVVTGLPVRKGFSSINKADARKELSIPEDAVCILSTGGSLGAGAINDSIVDLLKWYQDENKNVVHIHSYGTYIAYKNYIDRLKEKGINTEDQRLRISEYINNMPTCMAAADLVISRCGANSLTELEAIGRGSILVPSPVVAGNHQYYNGMVLDKAGAGICVEQKDFSSEWLIKTVNSLIEDKEKLDSLSNNAKKLYIKDTNDRIFDTLNGLIKAK